MVHHNFKKGKRVFIILKNGEKIIDKYLDTKGDLIILEKNSIKFSDIRSSTIFKNGNKVD